MSRTKPAVVRFYIDADLLGVARQLVQLRADVTYPGDPGAVFHKRERPPCPITTPEVKDIDWIPEVAARGWLIITRDRRIREHKAEIAAVRDHRAKMVVLTSGEASNTFAQLEIIMCQWRALERCQIEPAPFIYAATRTRLKKINLN